MIYSNRLASDGHQLVLMGNGAPMMMTMMMTATMTMT
jgi:hypothetical protein